MISITPALNPESRSALKNLVCVSLCFLLVYGPMIAHGAPGVTRHKPLVRFFGPCTPPTAEQLKTYKEAAAAVRSVQEKMNPAKADIEAINNALKKVTLDDSMISKFELVAQTLEAGVASRTGRLAVLKQLTTDLTDRVNILNKAVVPFEACKDEPTAEVKEVLADFKSITGVVPDNLKTVDKLQDTLKSIPEKVQTFLELIAAKTQGAISLPANLAPQTLRSELVTTLPDLAVALRTRRQFASIAARITKDLDPADHGELKPIFTVKPEFSFDEVDAQLQQALAKVGRWAQQAAEVARDQQAKGEDTLFKAMRDPFHQSGDALAFSTLAEKIGRDVTTIANAFLQLLSEMQKEDVPANILPPSFEETKARELSDATEILQLLSARLARLAVQLSGEIAVDKSTWTMASVDLFYFDNVDQLMHVLSQNVRTIGGRQEFQNLATTQRRALDEASQTLEDAEANVSDSRQAVANIQERVRQATVRRSSAVQRQRAQISGLRSTADAAEARDRAAALRLKRIDARKTLAETRLTRAQEAANAKPDDPDLKSRVNLAQQEVDQLTLQSADAKADQEKIHDEATNARTDADTPTTDVDQELAELNAELTKAQTALDSALEARSTATAAHRTALRSAFLAAQAENFAFAQARDNLPFLTNLPEPKAAAAEDESASKGKTPGPFIDTDPINRVLLFAFPDSRTIFIRGPQDDIDLVRQIIKEFDHPSGQALMTLRTIELNSDGTQDSARRTLAFLGIMDEELGRAQRQVEQAQSNLRTVINDQVRLATEQYEDVLRRRIAALPPGDQQNLLIVQLNRHEENETLSFYDPRVLEALGWRRDFRARTVDTNFLNAVIPPPSGTVNLAQALIALSLASTENRRAVVNQLTAPYFESLVRFLGPYGDSADVLGFQGKLVEALRFNGITHVLEVVTAKARLKLNLQEEQTRLRTELTIVGQEYEPLDRELSEVINELGRIREELRNATTDRRTTLERRAEELRNRQAGLVRRISPLQLRTEQIREPLFAANGSLAVVKRDLSAALSWLQGNANGISPEFLLKRIEEAISSTDDTSELLKQALGYRRSARFRFSQASESAVNLTFRKYLEQVNRDLTDAIIKPTFRRLNQRLIQERLGVGVIQETSILASNRFVARVDPRGSAQVAVGEEKNALEAAIQFANLLGLTGKTFLTGAASPLALGGPLGGGSSVLNTATGVLNALDEMPRGAAPEVYGIATGNVFQVTPVIDPSGQSLRFKFDFLSATQIREPNDTVNPQLPRIERHSINTEVQLADQEIRLISQFQANSRLGIAKRKSGGFPILKDIPGVSEVPLLGWFVKRGGRSAQTQQSFVFCQTTMYPTLSEVLDAAVRSPSFTGLETP